MKVLVVFLFLSVSFLTRSQELNPYKYIVVDNQYEFQNEANEYRLNDLMVFELKKRGFNAFKGNEVQPKDKNLGSCNTLNLKLEEAGVFRRTIVFFFEDCEGNIVFTTKKGMGKVKDNQKAYYRAVRDAMTSLDDYDYTYTPVEKVHEENSFSPDLQQKAETSQTVKTKSHIQAPAKKPSTKKEQFDLYKEVENNIYSLERIGNHNIKIFKNKEEIGAGKKTSADVYLINTSDFNGVGFLKDGVFIIEYETGGKLEKLMFKKD